MNFNNEIKKSLITASLVGLVIAVSSNAHASIDLNLENNALVYMGFGVGCNQYKFSPIFKDKIEDPSANNGVIKDQSLDVVMPFFGVRFKENYGIELGSQYQQNIKYSGLISGNLKLRNYYADAIGYLPVDEQIDLIGSFGVGYISLKERGVLFAMGNGNKKYRTAGVRSKIGVQYYLDLKFSIRATLGYQRIGENNNKRSVKNMRHLHLDLIYFY